MTSVRHRQRPRAGGTDRATFIPLYDMARRDEKAFLLADRLMYASAVSSNKVSEAEASNRRPARRVRRCPV